MVSNDSLPEAVIAAGSRVTLFFSLGLEDGELVDSNFSGQPATYTVGDGSLLPGFEAQILGLRAGQEVEVRLPPEAAFGTPNPANIQYLSRAQFNRFLDDEYAALEAGAVLAFKDAGGFDLSAVIKTVAPDGVTVDFNHPLAGKPILFKAAIVKVLAADTREVNLGL